MDSSKKMQTKIIDFASDKLVTALHKIDKKDVQKVMTNISEKLQSKNQQTTSTKVNGDCVTSSDEYCAMLKNEFIFSQFDPSKSKKKLDIDEKDAIVKIDKTDGAITVKEENCEKIDMHDQECANIHYESSVESTTTTHRPELNKQFSNDVQSFVQKKNIAQGMMDLALLSSNCNQLRYVLDMNGLHPYYFTSLILIGTSLVLQVIVGLGLLYTNSYNLRQRSEMRSASKFSSLSIVGVFLITIINVLIGTFNGTNFSAVASPQVKPENEPTSLATSAEPVMVQLHDEAI
ncbi:hypothetical protein PVAND_007878 [Polypedilum vanderplanki]|uniref:Ninjurin-1 n=1 Tax=Polypedilum vanderplanki TaxID=319348 RepID=A0A9J6C7Z2_POLVA|nr:hypothetical protein PVAND_007878 [Polypedilum vanderplanki]